MHTLILLIFMVPIVYICGYFHGWKKCEKGNEKSLKEMLNGLPGRTTLIVHRAPDSKDMTLQQNDIWIYVNKDTKKPKEVWQTISGKWEKIV